MIRHSMFRPSRADVEGHQEEPELWCPACNVPCLISDAKFMKNLDALICPVCNTVLEDM